MKDFIEVKHCKCDKFGRMCYVITWRFDVELAPFLDHIPGIEDFYDQLSTHKWII